MLKKIWLGGLTLPANIFMAPLVGYTCYPFRMLCYEMGAALCFTEMISSNALKYKDAANDRLLFTTSDEPVKAVQLLGSDARIMGNMACSDYLSPFDIVDINMGCPVPQVIKRGEGCALMMDKKKAAAIIRSVRRSGKIVTVKIRVGMNEKALIAAEFAKVCEDAGAMLITIHGRTRNMMYDGTPYFDQIEQAKSAVSIPVIANGGIFSTQDAEKMMNLTGADGIMIARYGLENPFIFSELTKKKITKNKYRILMEQIELTNRYYDVNFTLSYIKKLAAYFMKKQKGVKKYKSTLHECSDITDLQEVIKKIFDEREDKNGV